MQTQLDKDAAHMESTAELLLEVLEAQKVPNDIAVAALWETTLQLTMRESPNMLTALNALSHYLKTYNALVPLYVRDMYQEYFRYKESNPEEYVKILKILLKMKPENVILKDGKVVDIKP